MEICLCCKTELKPGTVHWWQIETCLIEKVPENTKGFSIKKPGYYPLRVG